MSKLTTITLEEIEQIGDVQECIICFFPFSDEKKEDFVQLKCHEKHIFHSNCLKEWFMKGNVTCPNCRKTVTE